jgi:hypothetical protein
MSGEEAPSPTWDASRICVVAAASRSLWIHPLLIACMAARKIGALGQWLAK